MRLLGFFSIVIVMTLSFTEPAAAAAPVLTLTVDGGSAAPVPPSFLAKAVGDSVVFEVDGTDTDGDTLTFTVEHVDKDAVPITTALVYAAGTGCDGDYCGTFTWAEIDCPAALRSPHFFNLCVSDGTGSTTCQEMIMVVMGTCDAPELTVTWGGGNPAPVPPSFLAKTVGDPLIFEVDATDANGDELEFTIEHSDQAGARTTTPLVYAAGTGCDGDYCGTFSWAEIDCQANLQSPHFLNICVSDATGLTTCQEVIMLVVGTCAAPELTVTWGGGNPAPVPPSFLAKTVGDPLVFEVDGIDTNGDALEFTIEHVDKDGATITTPLVYAAGTGCDGDYCGTFTWAEIDCQANLQSPHFFDICVSDATGLTTCQEVIMVVVGACNAPEPPAFIGLLLHDTLIFSFAATDADGDPLTFTVEHLDKHDAEVSDGVIDQGSFGCGTDDYCGTYIWSSSCAVRDRTPFRLTFCVNDGDLSQCQEVIVHRHQLLMGRWETIVKASCCGKTRLR